MPKTKKIIRVIPEKYLFKDVFNLVICFLLLCPQRFYAGFSKFATKVSFDVNISKHFIHCFFGFDKSNCLMGLFEVICSKTMVNDNSF